MTLIKAYKEFVTALSAVYSRREAGNIAELVFENVTGITRLKRITEKDLLIARHEVNKINAALAELLLHKPVQYVLGEAWFCGKKFIVNDAVLIPRPETEELVELVIHDPVCDQQNFSILDIGTGSGCIAITLKARLPKAIVSAVDISDTALAVAKINGENNNASILWRQADILNEIEWNNFEMFDIIVSNPPYIPDDDKNSMADNVLKYEPHVALFAPVGDSLIFYRAIAAFGKDHLKEKGKIFVEIHEGLAENVADVFNQNGYTVSIHKDMMGKDRMVTAWR